MCALLLSYARVFMLNLRLRYGLMHVCSGVLNDKLLDSSRPIMRMSKADMSEKEPNLITSGLSGHQTTNGITVELCIYRLENSSGWTLEVVNASGTSIVWDNTFQTDIAANEEFQRTVNEEGMATFLDDENVIQFPS